MVFAPRSPTDIVSLIAAHPLAWVVSRDFDATPLPLLAECNAEGRLVSLFGHYARLNPQVAVLGRDPAALILFNGPQGYMSPALVSKPDWGPTWNYAAVRITADMALVPTESDASVRRLVAHLEPGDTLGTSRRWANAIPRCWSRVTAHDPVARTSRQPPAPCIASSFIRPGTSVSRQWRSPQASRAASAPSADGGIAPPSPPAANARSI